ncbi:hypothetical protein K438DRAFT_1755085 [Mycena galopus ATCC 62051]|nr:hypothetical protein K438DRAFT_1755085 [Mycena galopus ATCC 62051]
MNMLFKRQDQREKRRKETLTNRLLGIPSRLFTVPLFPGTIYTTVGLSTSHTHTIRTTAYSNEEAVHAAALGENGRRPQMSICEENESKDPFRERAGRSCQAGSEAGRTFEGRRFVSALKKIIAHALEKKAGETKKGTRPDLEPFSLPSHMRSATLSAHMTTSSAIVRSMLQRPRHENPAQALVHRHGCHQRVVVRDGVDVRRNDDRPRRSRIVKGARSSAARRPQFLFDAEGGGEDNHVVAYVRMPGVQRSVAFRSGIIWGKQFRELQTLGHVYSTFKLMAINLSPP